MLLQLHGVANSVSCKLSPPRLSLQHMGEAHDPADKGVIMRVGGGSQACRETVIELVLRWNGRRRCRNLKTKATESRGSDEQEQ